MTMHIVDFVPDGEGSTRGTLAIRSDYRNYDKPQIDRIWWPIDRCRRDQFERYIGQEVTAINDGIYIMYAFGNPIRFILENGGQTKALKTEAIEIPRPKTRLETRWHQGAWQKYSKSKGWEYA